MLSQKQCCKCMNTSVSTFPGIRFVFLGFALVCLKHAKQPFPAVARKCNEPKSSLSIANLTHVYYTCSLSTNHQLNHDGTPPPPPPSSQRTPRSATTALNRLVGGDRRAVVGLEEPVTSLSSSPKATGATVAAGIETDELPFPCACPLLKDGWSRRASSSYSPFFDGNGVWSPSEAARVSTEKEESTTPFFGSAEGEEGGEREQKIGSFDEQTMPIPTVVADLLIGSWNFSLR